ncbi:FtsX-like permease family protein [Streptomyces sp. NPDC093085]|uniref:ABC transporter permease n=1 Tax=Streptomyces sp. NPDC093085 TaxID=3155068 RepID=UPI003424AB9D
MFRTALRTVLAHKARLLMTVLAVMLGVAFVSGTLIFTDTLGNAFRNQYAKSYKDVAVSITSSDYRDSSDQDERKLGAGLGPAVMDRISALDGVTAVTGRVQGFAGVADTEGNLIGDGWSNRGSNFAAGKDGKDPAYTFTKGSGPVKNGEIALDESSAAKGDYQVGDTVRVATNGPVKEYTLAGIFTTEDGGVNAGGSLVLFDTPTAQKLYLEPGYFSDATVRSTAGTSESALLSQVEKIIPENAEAQSGKALAEQQAKDIEASMKNLNQMLLAFAAIALFVGVFLISNTFTMLVAQRTKELALLRAVGASRRQVKRSVLIEAAIVGLIASVIGFVLGLGLAVGLRSLMGSFGAKIPGGPLIVSPTAIGAAFAVGVLITVFAAWLPARRAAKIAPVAAMSSVHAVATTKSLVVRNSIGAVLTLIGAAGIMGGASQGDDGRLLIAAGAFFAMIGIIVLIPLLSRPVIALLRPALVGAFGVSGKLAAQNAVRNPRRTGATASALAIGLTLVTGLSVLGVTVGHAVDKMTTDHVKADYVVSMASYEGLDPSVLTELKKAKGVTAISPRVSVGLEWKDGWESASGVVPGDFEKVFDVTTVSGSLDSLSGDAIAVSEEKAKENGWKLGQTVTFKYSDQKSQDLKIGAIFEGADELIEPVLISTRLTDAHNENPWISQVWVKTTTADDSQRQALVDALGKSPAIKVMNQEDIRNEYTGVINTMLNILYGLLAMALIIAVLGVINTLAMSVFERQQEIGMLRAIGLDRPRVKRMIRLEAVVISLFGAVIGIGLGTFLAWAIGETIKASIPDYSLVIPWDRVGIFLVLAGLVGVLAALWPARSAAKLNMLTAIKTE